MGTAGIISTLLILSCIVCFAEKQTRSKRNGDESQLMSVAPHSTDGNPLKIICSIYFLDIRELDAKKMEFTTQFYFRQKWTDSRVPSYIINKLKMEPSREWKFNDLPSIWKPDLFIVEGIHGRQSDVIRSNSFLRVYENGTVFWSVRLNLKLRCGMDFRALPHDNHACKISFESYGYTADDMATEWLNNTKNENCYEDRTLQIFDFSLDSVDYGKEVISFATGNYTRLFVNMHFQRRISFFLTKFYFPYIFLVLVAGLTFWINPQLVPLRLALLLSVLIIMLALNIEIASYVPPTAYTKAIDIWTGFSLTLVFGAFLEFIFVCQITKQRRNSSGNKSMEDPEILISQEVLMKDDKKDPEMEITNSATKFVARNLCKVNEWLIKTDVIFRYAYLTVFGLFNLIYWAVYAP